MSTSIKNRPFARRSLKSFRVITGTRSLAGGKTTHPTPGMPGLLLPGASPASGQYLGQRGARAAVRHARI